ncbi:hypothetical protein HID58_051776, partial [Brassica napus]
SKKKAKITEQPNPLQTLPPGLRLPPRLFATDRFSIKCLNIYSLPEIFGSYDRKNQAVVSVTFRFEAPQTTLRRVKAVEDVHRRLCSLSYPKELDHTQVKDLKTTIYLLTPTSPELDVKKPQDIVRPGSLILLAEAYDRCVQ